MNRTPMKPIPVSAAKNIAQRYGYDQVIVIARRVGDAPAPHGEHMTTYGSDEEHCRVAANVGNFLKHKVMGWPEFVPTKQDPEAARLCRAIVNACDEAEEIAACKALAKWMNDDLDKALYGETDYTDIPELARGVRQQTTATGEAT